MRKFALFLFLLVPLLCNSQQIVEGIVSDFSNGKFIPNASLFWQKDKTGTTTDQNGIFKINLSSVDNDTLTISHLGYELMHIPAKELNISNKKTNHIKLIPVAYLVPTFCVTATREKCNLKHIPQKISVIDSALLNSFALKSIDDALAYSSGVMIDRPMGIFAAKSVVTMRGLSGNEQGRTLVLIDGIPINKSDGGTVNFNLIDPNSINSIEVVKGPASALYGGNAMGGVINIISDIPSEKLSGRVKLGYSTFNTYSGNLAINSFLGKGINKGFFYSGNAFWRKSDGYISKPEYQRTEYTVPVFLNEKMFSFKGGYKFNEKNHFWLSAMIYDDERGAGEKVYTKLGSYSEHDSYHLRGQLKTEYKNWKITANSFFLCENYAKINEYVKSGEYTLYDVDSKRKDVGFIVHASKQIFPDHTLTYGVEIRQGSVNAADVYHTSTDKIINAGIMNLYALFVQDEYIFGKDRWKFVGGLRFDNAYFHNGQFSVENPGMNNMYLLAYEKDNMPEKTWNSLSPKAAIQYRINNNEKFFGSFAHGFRAPILDDLCRSGKTRGGFQVANSDLTPETLENFEIGYQREFKSKSIIEPVVFFSYGKNFMYPVSTGDTVDMGYAAPVIITSNVSKVRIIGAEIDFNYQITKSLNCFFNYAYSYSVVVDYTPTMVQQINIEGLYLSNVPAHLSNFGLQYKFKNIGASVNARYVSSRWVNDTNTPDEKYGLPAMYAPYFTADIKLSYLFKNRWLVSASVINVSDKIYTDSKGQYCPGRMISIDAGIKF